MSKGVLNKIGRVMETLIGVFKGVTFLLWVQISIITVFIKQEIKKERNE